MASVPRVAEGQRTAGSLPIFRQRWKGGDTNGSPAVTFRSIVDGAGNYISIHEKKPKNWGNALEINGPGKKGWIRVPTKQVQRGVWKQSQTAYMKLRSEIATTEATIAAKGMPSNNTAGPGISPAEFHVRNCLQEG